MESQDPSTTVSDKAILKSLIAVFGVENVLPASHPDALENSFTLRIENSDLRHEIFRLLIRSVDGLLVMEGLGGFSGAGRNKLGIALGTEEHRRRHSHIQEQAKNLIGFLDGNQHALRTMACGDRTCPYRT